MNAEIFNIILYSTYSTVPSWFLYVRSSTACIVASRRHSNPLAQSDIAAIRKFDDFHVSAVMINQALGCPGVNTGRKI